MQAALARLLLLMVLGAADGTRYTFYRTAGARRGAADGAGGAARRVFGGAAARLGAWPGACALLDATTAPRCSCGVLASHWAVTAAHCVAPHVMYVRHNSDSTLLQPFAEVLMLYKHPEYMAVQETTAAGPDVVALQHDVGLVRTRGALAHEALTRAPADVLHALREHDLLALARQGELVRVFGFGRTERSAPGEELYTVRLQLVGCERRRWTHCACAAARRGPMGGAGVCAGDSGGPVVFEGAQVGVTSMGPAECRAGAQPAAAATSVLTSLHQYAAIVNATITGAEDHLRMRGWQASHGAPTCHRSSPVLAALLLAAPLRALAHDICMLCFTI